VRIFKLIKLMHLFVLSSMDEFGKTDFRVFNQFPFTVQEIRKHNEAAPEGRREYEKGILLYERGDFAGAEKAMKQVVALNPRSVEGYIGLGLTQFRREKSNETLDSFLRAYELNAAETEEETGGLKGMKILKCLYLCCLANPGSRSAVSGKCRELFSRCPALKEELEIFLETVDRDAKKKIEAWIRSDIGQIINYCRQRDIAVVLQSYPRYPDFEASRIRQSLFREIAAEHGVPFVDQAEIFSRLSPIGKYFAPDNSHPNELGNQIMAENVYAAILPLLQSRR
jgi:tetratricopeptide (TPR) repeat protein